MCIQNFYFLWEKQDLHEIIYLYIILLCIKDYLYIY
jgi:hypothetical protein